MRVIRAAFIAAACLLGLQGKPAYSQGGQSEYAVKAAFLFNFAKFVEWPAQSFSASGGNLVIGVLGSDPFGSQLDDAMSGKSIDGHRVVVKRYATPQSIDHCQILFVPSGSMSHVGDLTALKGRPTLIIGETDGFARKYGHIGFFFDRNRLGFEINPNASKACGLSISSKLLSLARTVS